MLTHCEENVILAGMVGFILGSFTVSLVYSLKSSNTNAEHGVQRDCRRMHDDV